MNPAHITQEPNKEKNESNRPAETDSERIVHRHLQNKDDIITDEDIRNIRVGFPDEPTISTEVQATLKEAAGETEGETPG